MWGREIKFKDDQLYVYDKWNKFDQMFWTLGRTNWLGWIGCVCLSFDDDAFYTCHVNLIDPFLKIRMFPSPWKLKAEKG